MGNTARFVTVIRLTDPVQAQVIRDVLEQEGIAATTAGISTSALFGASGRLMDIHVQVPEDLATRAHDIISAMDDESSVLVDDDDEARGLLGPGDRSGVADDRGAGPYRRPEVAPPKKEPRLKRVAACLSLVITFGTGHFYAREHVTGTILLLAELAAILASGNGPFFLVVPVVMLLDLVGSMRAVARHNQGAPLSAAGQALRTVPIVAAAFVVAAWAVPLLTPEPDYSAPDSVYFDDFDTHP